MATERTYKVLLPFCGSGNGARGFLDARAKLLGAMARFHCIGGIDIDPASCADFEYLTGAPALCADIAMMTAEDLLKFAGLEAPDVVFSSPPCKGNSGLLSKEMSETEKYQDMNRLVVDWLELVLRAWPDAPPRLMLIENVPGIQKRGADLLKEVKSLLRKHGYAFNESSHDCGELGGLAQHRHRFLLVARHQKRVPPLLYKPPSKRVRGVGEVLERLPLPEDPAGGVMHTMSKLSWLNWARIALIPGGGDYRDLPNVLAKGQKRRELFRRYRIESWTAPSAAITGPGGHSTFGVADPRVGPSFDHGYRVLRWSEPSFTVAGKVHPGTGAYTVADPRFPSAFVGPIDLEDVRRSITEPGPWAIFGPDSDEPLWVIEQKKPPPFVPVIIAADGTWHRPFTPLDLAALQDFPTTWNDAPLKLHGMNRTKWHERIGNAVPRATAEAVATQMLITLMQGDAEAFALSGSQDVWLEPFQPEALYLEQAH